MKTVSVYIPTHNRPEFLNRALASLVNQDTQGFQVLVCDDGSNKENKRKVSSIIKDYKDKFADLVFFDIEQPQGACSARNLMINAAEGKYITGLDDDDEFGSNRIRLFLENKDIEKYSYLSSGIMVNDGKKIEPFIQSKGETTLSKLLFSNIVGNQVFTKTENLKALGGFDTSFPSWQDYDLWVRLTKEMGPGLKTQDCTYILNIDHELGRITNSSRVKEGYIKFIDKHNNILNAKHLKSLEIQNLINSSAQPNFSLLIKTMGKKTTYDLLNYWMKKKLPNTSLTIRKILRTLRHPYSS